MNLRLAVVFVQLTTGEPSYKYNRLNYCWSCENLTSNCLTSVQPLLL